MTTKVEKSIQVDAPVRAVYNQWTQFEEFPQFMEGVSEIRQLSDSMTHWKTEIGGIKREFDAKITEQLPDERVAWTSIEGSKQAGVVTFHRLDEGKSRVMLQLEFEPEGAMEKAGDKLGVIKTRAKNDLKRFKSFIENRGRESGAWRGDVPQTKN